MMTRCTSPTFIAGTLRLIGLVTLLALSACGDDGSSSGDPLGAYCYDDDACGSGLCLEGFCSSSCDSDADCSSDELPMVCGVGPDGSNVCAPGCSTLASGFACDGGIAVHCSQVTTDSCGSCGCDGSTYCDYDTDACLPLETVGNPCTRDSHCASDNCSEISHVCRVPIGAACTNADCDRCESRSGVGTYCSRECDSNSDCDGDLCIGNSSIDLYYCANECSPSNTSACPGECDPVSGSSDYFCDCESGTCSVTSAQAPVGSWCRGDHMCSSGDCWSRVERSWSIYSKRIGWCTETCASDGDCPLDGACVNVDCNQSTGCQALCVPRCDSTSCDVGYCLSMPNVSGGGNTDVCTIRQPDGSSCYSDYSCQSANCNQFDICE